MIEIKSRIAYNWFYWLSFKYKVIKKDVFVDRYKWSDIIENCKKFLNIIKNLGPYLVKFEENRLLKTKKYLDNYIIGRDKHCFIIVIIYNKYIFSITNNRI